MDILLGLVWLVIFLLVLGPEFSVKGKVTKNQNDWVSKKKRWW